MFVAMVDDPDFITGPIGQGLQPLSLIKDTSAQGASDGDTD
jgi:hypothetical protein